MTSDVATTPPPATWSAPVRYAEVDQQRIVFNSHYLIYCDEAMGAFCAQHGILDEAQRLHLVASSLSWRASARWGDVVDVHASCVRVGVSSLVIQFVVSVAGVECCTVETTYVHALDGRSAPLPDTVRSALD